MKITSTTTKKNKEYMKSYREKHKDYFKEYNKNYYNNNKEYFKAYMKNYREKRLGYYLYIIINLDEIIYVGATLNLQARISKHINKHNPNTRKIFESGNWTSIKYLDISNIVYNREEMLLLENCLIDLYNTKINKRKTIIKNVDRQREFSLVAEVHNLNQKWITYCENEQKNKLIKNCSS